MTAQECVFGLTLHYHNNSMVVTVHVCAGRHLRSEEIHSATHRCFLYRVEDIVRELHMKGANE